MANRRTEAHEKSMGSYELFAWRDSLAIAEMIDDLFGSAAARRAYESFSEEAVIEYELENQELIADFIQKSELQRESFFGRITRDRSDDTKVLFLTLALIGVLRAKAVMELRDRFRSVLAPGRGNRITTAALYEFSIKFFAVYAYEWPEEPFEALGLDDDVEDDEVN